MARNSFGSVRKLPSGRFQARYSHQGETFTAGRTFPTKLTALEFLSSTRRAIDLGVWEPPEEQRARESAKSAVEGQTVGTVLTTHINAPGRAVRTRDSYLGLVANRLQSLTALPLQSLTAAGVRKWWEQVNAEHDTAAMNLQAYRLLRAAMQTAVEGGLIQVNPCTVTVRQRAAKSPYVPTREELERVLEYLPEDMRAGVLTAALCALRVGEWTELRGKDVLTRRDGVYIRVSRAVVQAKGGGRITGTKTGTVRTIPVPGGLGEELTRRAKTAGEEGLLFTGARGGRITASHLNPALKESCELAGVEQFTSHSLRHYGATEFTRAGATLADVQARLGHSTTTAAMRYQHTDDRRAREVADKLTIPSVQGVCA